MGWGSLPKRSAPPRGKDQRTSLHGVPDGKPAALRALGHAAGPFVAALHPAELRRVEPEDGFTMEVELLLALFHQRLLVDPGLVSSCRSDRICRTLRRTRCTRTC